MSELDQSAMAADVPASVGGVSHRAIIDALTRAVVVTDQSGRILLWSDAAEQLYGWAEEDVVDRSVLEVLAPAADLAENRQDLNFVAAGNTLSGDRSVVGKDGEVIRVFSATRPIVDTDGQTIAMVGTSEDVTERRAAEQHARDIAEHLGLALQAGGLGTWRWDMATGETVWDERLEALFGLAPGEFDGTFDTYVSLLHPDDREEVLQVVHQAVASRSEYRIDHRVVWPDGSIHWLAGSGSTTFDEHGVTTGTIGCSADITDRVMKEHERIRLAQLAIEAADAERVQRERLEFLGAINDALNNASSVEEIMKNVTTSVVPRLGDWCSIHVLPDRDARVPVVTIAHVEPEMVAYAQELQSRFPYDPDASTGVSHVIRTGQTMFYPEITDDEISDLAATDEEQAVIRQLGLRSAITVPLIKRGRVLGAMQFVMSTSSRRYTSDDVTLAHTVAGRIASSLENARLNDQQRVIAQTLQRSLLPASLPHVPGVEIAVRYWPAGEMTEVGGDFYDVFSLETGRWAFVIGDVCGTGPTAASLTGLARHTIRDSAWHGDTPNEVLQSLNRAVKHADSGSFLTAVYATLDTNADQLTLNVACGGHPLPVLAAAGSARSIGFPGTLLGVFDSGSFSPEVTTLHAGDAVLFYTDGATDVRRPYGLDSEQFAQVVGRAASDARSAEAIADEIHKALDSIVSFDRRDDDIALLVLRIADTG
jgi:PAS domain S-box-containing protein